MSTARSEYLSVADEALVHVSNRSYRHALAGLFADAQAEVNAGTASLVILAARRLACVYQLLRAAGMPPLVGCDVVSDRYLDSRPERNWAAERVLVLDESIVVGTTLRRLHDRLIEEFGVERGHIRFRTVCVDRNQIARYLIDDLDVVAVIDAPTSDVEKFSSDLVVSFFSELVPFFSDFPVTSRLVFDEAAFKLMLDSSDWSVADATAPLLDHTGTTTVSLIPRAATLRRLESRMLPSAAELLDGLKVRLFTRQTGTTNHIVVVPLAFVGATSTSVLNQVLADIAESLRGQDRRFGIRWEDWRPEAKHRLVQMYLSACLLADVWPLIQTALVEPSKLGREVLDSSQASLYFGEASTSILDAFEEVVATFGGTEEGVHHPPVRRRLASPPPSALLNRPGLEDTLAEAREILQFDGGGAGAIVVPDEPDQGKVTKVGLIFFHTIASIFGYINREYEEPQRAEIRALKSLPVYVSWLSVSGGRVLDHGLTMRELATALLPERVAGQPWDRLLVSLGIDGGNDLGIIVPTTRWDEDADVVYRLYRIGETAFLADRPLPAAIRDGRIGYDELSRAARRFPISSTEREIQTLRLPPATSRRRPRWDRRLRNAIHTAVPGPVLDHFDGVVTSVSDDSFDARLVSIAGTEEAVATLSIHDIDKRSTGALRPGALISWSTFKRNDGATEPRLRVRAGAALDPEELERVAEAWEFLSFEEDESDPDD